MTTPSRTFLQAAATAPDAVSTPFAVLGIPRGVAYPGRSSGAIGAPRALRERSSRYGDMVAHHDFDLGRPLAKEGILPFADCGDAADDALDTARGSTAATAAVRRILRRGAVPIVLGGDDSTTAIALRAYVDRGPLTILQIDAHIDYRDEVDGVRDGASSPMRRAAEMPWVRRIVHCGTRGVGSARPEDVAATRARGNVIVTAREIHERGVARVLDEFTRDETCYLAFDCDGLDPSVMPGTATPLPGGLTYAQASDLVVGLARRGRLAGANFAEYDPDRDVNGITALAIVRLIVQLIGAGMEASP